MNRAWFGPALLALFVASGFAGLVYQSIWSHYLGLMLGHAAYAQTLVLAIFMGGMALGAWGVSRYSGAMGDLIKAYAVIEVVIGVFGLAFHPVFEAYLSFSQDSVLPALGSSGAARTYQWLSAALLILPQSVLLGATFPLMSSGYLRASPGEDGRVLGGLYFTNSLGAAAGALGATFLLLPAVGMPGTVMTAAVINILVGIGAWLVAVGMPHAPARVQPDSPRPQEPAQESAPTSEVSRLVRLMLWATFISGAASFVYEIGWVRMLNQALGTTIHSFELMLAAFILGLAFGGLWVRRRGSRIRDAIKYVGYVQVLMGVAALLSIPVFAQSFSWVGWLMGALARTDSGYTIFSLGSATISLLVMFPAAFFAGMTLPLFTMVLLRAGAGESSIGRIYAANTLGAIAGVAIAVHLLIPVLGLRLAVTLAALVDAVLGLYLLRVMSPGRWSAGAIAAALVVASASMLSLVHGRPDPQAQISGVFRTGNAIQPSTDVQYLRDGKTATVAVFNTNNTAVIATNGKPDASLTRLNEEPTADEITMLMAALLPLAMHEEPERVAIIGWGSGLTTHTILGSSTPKVVDNIEIERAMYDGARLFGERVVRAYDDPRSFLHVEDARTFFAAGGKKYDVIVSEPSNPWVSGVATLFTKEFYSFLDGHLEDDGILVQWIQSYEISDELVATLVAALLEQFPNSELYLTNQADLLIVARKSPGPPAIQDPGRLGAVLVPELSRVGLATSADIRVRRIAGPAVLRNFVHLMGAQPYSDFYPKVSLEGPRTRFTGQNSALLQRLALAGAPVLEMLDCRRPVGMSEPLTNARHSALVQASLRGKAVVESVVAGGASPSLATGDPQLAAHVDRLMSMAHAGGTRFQFTPWAESITSVAGATLGALPSEDLLSIWASPDWVGKEAGEHGMARPILDAYGAAARRDPVAMLDLSAGVLMNTGVPLPPDLREHLLVIAMVGAIGSGRGELVPDLDRELGAPPATSTELADVRAFLLAWADSGSPACAGTLPPAQAGPGG